jgi:hypothetical protein
LRKLSIFVMLALLLGLTAVAQATIINGSGDTEANSALWQIISSWGHSVNQNDLQNATLLTTIPAGAYKVTDYAGYAGFRQQVGDFDSTGSVPAKTPNTALITVAENFRSNVTGVNIPFSQSNAIAFYDYPDGINYNVITTNGISNIGAGLIFNLSQFGGSGYAIAFEDGNSSGLGDKDYNDFVCKVTAPIPGNLLLLGSGILGMMGIGIRRKPS